MKMRILTILASFTVLALSTGAFAQQMYDDHHGWDMHGYGYGGYLLWFLIIVLAALAFFFIFRQQPGRSGSSGETALDILKKRYARGEISKEEYEGMKQDIQ
jgi:putative membrane protein